MMNYLWAGLIAISLVFALWTDASDFAYGSYRNGVPLPVTITVPQIVAVNLPAGGQPVTVSFDPELYHRHFNQELPEDLTGGVAALLTDDELNFVDPRLPPRLAEMRLHFDETNKALRGQVIFPERERDHSRIALAGRSVQVQVLFENVRCVKIRAITRAAFEFAEKAVTLALGLIGVLALWLGLLKIAEASGIVALFVTIVQPFLGVLFPSVPRNHPALAMIALNLAANMLGLGNAATPMGLKAMAELQKLNPNKDTATDAMVMLLALNTAGVQLLPSPTLLAVMGMSAVNLLFPMLIVTSVCAVLAVIAARVFARLPVFRKTSPDVVGRVQDPTAPAPETEVLR